MLRAFFTITTTITTTITITITITNKHERNGAVCVRCVCARAFLYYQYHHLRI